MNEQTVNSLVQPKGEAMLLDVGAVAQLCTVSSQTIRRLHGRGQFPEAVRIGRSVRWHRDEVMSWLKDRGRLRRPAAGP
jgi:excisionase family DNA binding protein